MSICLHISPTSFVMVWCNIFRLYGAGLNFGNLNFNFNCFVMILMLNLPFNITFFTKKIPICTWITIIWLSVTTFIVVTFGIIDGIFFLLLFYLQSMVYRVSFFAIDIFSTQEPFLVTIPSSKYNWFPTSIYWYLEISFLPISIYFGKF